MLPCKDCPNNMYVGQTGRDLSKRIKEHKRDNRAGDESSTVFSHERDFDN